MRLKLLAISDTHLGEDTSLLSFPRGRQHVHQILRDCFGEGEKKERFEVEEVILLGDVTDRTLSSTSQIITHTNAFIQMLGNAADIKKGVFIPGNHEHTLWTDYHRWRDVSEGQASKNVFLSKSSKKLSRKRRFLIVQSDFCKIIDVVRRKICFLTI